MARHSSSSSAITSSERRVDRRAWVSSVLALAGASACQALGVVSPTKRAPARVTFTSGPWTGVRNTLDPFDDQDVLITGQNGWIPDPNGASGFYARTGFQLANGGTPVYSVGNFAGQCVHSHAAADGTIYNFVVFGGHLFRANSTFTTWTDVTPGGVTIDGGLFTVVKMVTQANNLVVNDGVNKPWIATNLGSTPITGTSIQYNAASDPWKALDVTVWQGSIVFGNLTVGGVARPYDIAWSEPGLPATGYEQTGSSNFMPVQQTGSDPLTAVVGTNVALFFFRRNSIGRIYGDIGSLTSSNTTDSAAYNIGTRAAGSIRLFGDTLFFVDAVGRPWSLGLTAATPSPIWEQMRADVESFDGRTGNEAVMGTLIRSAIEPTRNLYLAAVFPDNVPNRTPPTLAYGFDGPTSRHIGYWAIGGAIAIEAMGTLIDATGRAVLTVLGSLSIPSTTRVPSGYVWMLRAQDDATPYAESGSGGANVNCSIITGRMGFGADTQFVADTATVIARNAGSTVIAGWQSTGSNGSVNVAPVGDAGVGDQMSRYVFGLAAQGKGVQITAETLSPSGDNASFQRVTVTGRLLRAAVGDP